MIGSVIVASALMVAQTAAPANSGDKQKTTSKPAAAVDLQKAESEYNLLKEKTPMTAARGGSSRCGVNSTGSRTSPTCISAR